MKEINTLLGLLFAILVLSILISFKMGQNYYKTGGENVETKALYHKLNLKNKKHKGTKDD